MLDRIDGDTAFVSGKGQRTVWAKRPSRVFCADLFDTRAEAQAEYRRRRALATADDPNTYLNFTSQCVDQWATP